MELASAAGSMAAGQPINLGKISWVFSNAVAVPARPRLKTAPEIQGSV